MFLHAARHIKVALERADVTSAREAYLSYVLEIGGGGYVYLTPVVAATALIFETCYLLVI